MSIKVFSYCIDDVCQKIANRTIYTSCHFNVISVGLILEKIVYTLELYVAFLLILTSIFLQNVGVKGTQLKYWQPGQSYSGST